MQTQEYWRNAEVEMKTKEINVRQNSDEDDEVLEVPVA